MSKFVCEPLFFDTWDGGKTQVGIAMGHACNQMSRFLLGIETIKAYTSTNDGIHSIGNLGESMRIRITIAHIFARSYKEKQLKIDSLDLL